MSIALQIRVDELCRQVSDLTARVRLLEDVISVAKFQVDHEKLSEVVHKYVQMGAEGDDALAKRKPGRPKKDAG